MYTTMIVVLMGFASPTAVAMSFVGYFDPTLSPEPSTPQLVTIEDDGDGSDHDTIDAEVPDQYIVLDEPGWSTASTSFHMRYTTPHDYTLAEFDFEGAYIGAFSYTDTDGECLDSTAHQDFQGSMHIRRALPAEAGMASFRFTGAHNGEGDFAAEAHEGTPNTLLDVVIDGVLAAPDATQYIRYGFYVPSDLDRVDIRLTQSGTPPVFAAIYNAHGTRVALLDASNGGAFDIDDVRVVGGVWTLAIHGGFAGVFTAHVTAA